MKADDAGPVRPPEACQCGECDRCKYLSEYRERFHRLENAEAVARERAENKAVKRERQYRGWS